jgi:MFS family permease
MWNSIIPLFMLIVVGFLLHEMPQRKKSISSDTCSDKKTLDEFTFMEAIKNKNLWFIILMAMCIFYAIMGMTTNAFLFLKDSGFNTQVASNSATLLFLGSLIGKISCGFFAEDYGRKKVLLCYFVFLIIGASLLTLSVSNNNSYFIWFGLGTFGLGFGGIYTLKQLLSADLFGLKSLGKITGIINLTDTIGAGLGPVMTGFFFDRTGNYQFSFLIILIVVLFSMIFASFLKINDNEIEQRKLSQIQ